MFQGAGSRGFQAHRIEDMYCWRCKKPDPSQNRPQLPTPPSPFSTDDVSLALAGIPKPPKKQLWHEEEGKTNPLGPPKEPPPPLYDEGPRHHLRPGSSAREAETKEYEYVPFSEVKNKIQAIYEYKYGVGWERSLHRFFRYAQYSHVINHYYFLVDEHGWLDGLDFKLDPKAKPEGPDDMMAAMIIYPNENDVGPATIDMHAFEPINCSYFPTNERRTDSKAYRDFEQLFRRYEGPDRDFAMWHTMVPLYDVEDYYALCPNRHAFQVFDEDEATLPKEAQCMYMYCRSYMFQDSTSIAYASCTECRFHICRECVENFQWNREKLQRTRSKFFSYGLDTATTPQVVHREWRWGKTIDDQEALESQDSRYTTTFTRPIEKCLLERRESLLNSEQENRLRKGKDISIAVDRAEERNRTANEASSSRRYQSRNAEEYAYMSTKEKRTIQEDQHDWNSSQDENPSKRVRRPSDLNLPEPPAPPPQQEDSPAYQPQEHAWWSQRGSDPDQRSYKGRMVVRGEAVRDPSWHTPGSWDETRIWTEPSWSSSESSQPNADVSWSLRHWTRMEELDEPYGQ